MEAYLLSWASLLLRWGHIIAGIAWIGSSFYFMWLDARLNRPALDPECDAIEGDLWAVHGGGFYHAQKYQTAPEVLPEPLHWFKWEAYWTFITGFSLLWVVYYSHPQIYLIDPQGLQLEPWQAVGTSLFLLIAVWPVYQGLCALKISDGWVALLGALLILLLAWAVTHLFSGRGAFVQVGIMLGSIMVANVFYVIIPAQKALVAAKLEATTPDPTLGLKAKRRSTHNNYLTLPVVFVMISPHYAMLYGHAWNWLLLFALFLIGALIRHFFNERNKGRIRLLYPGLALALLMIVVYALAPQGNSLVTLDTGGTQVKTENIFAGVEKIVFERCRPCHSRDPTHPAAPVAGAGVELDSGSDILQWAPRIEARAVSTETMPLGNLTGMTEAERRSLGAWFNAGMPTPPDHD